MDNNCQTVIFSNKAYNAIIDEAFRKDPVETGGILLGHVLDNGLWIVMEVLPPGLNCIHEISYFEYDEAFVNYLWHSVASKYARPLDVLGLWHRHPGSMDFFSGTDDGTNQVFAQLSQRGAISGLVNIDPAFRLTLRHVSYPLHYEIVEYEVGDEIIPEEYFELRHYPARGLHPTLDLEKKNGVMSIGSASGKALKQSRRKRIWSLLGIDRDVLTAAGVASFICLLGFFVIPHSFNWKEIQVGEYVYYDKFWMAVAFASILLVTFIIRTFKKHS